MPTKNEDAGGPCRAALHSRLTVEFRIQRVLKQTSFEEEARTRPALEYWLSRSPEERVAAVEFLRRQVDGAGARLRRVHRVLVCPWG